MNCGIGESFYEDLALSIRMSSEQTNWRTKRCLKYLLKYLSNLVFFIVCWLCIEHIYWLFMNKIHLEKFVLGNALIRIILSAMSADYIFCVHTGMFWLYMYIYLRLVLLYCTGQDSMASWRIGFKSLEGFYLWCWKVGFPYQAGGTPPAAHEQTRSHFDLTFCQHMNYSKRFNQLIWSRWTTSVQGGVWTE